jgi:hypothetical protein
VEVPAAVPGIVDVEDGNTEDVDPASGVSCLTPLPVDTVVPPAAGADDDDSNDDNGAGSI